MAIGFTSTTHCAGRASSAPAEAPGKSGPWSCMLIELRIGQEGCTRGAHLPRLLAKDAEQQGHSR
eukprot:269300-Pelagomonas_calceolata.AAC.19